MAIPRNLKRSPYAEHVKKWIAYREKKGRPKALLPSVRGIPLTFERYAKLMHEYESRASKDLDEKSMRASRQIFMARDLLRDERDLMERTKLKKTIKDLRLIEQATVSRTEAGYEIANEIIKDFGHTKGLRVFGFGAGYGQLLFFLKHFMGAKVMGVDLGKFSEEFSKAKKLRVMHGKSVADASLKKIGKFDATYSINVFESDVLDKETAIGMLDNLAHLTRKGGKSYHYILFKEYFPFSNEEIESRGFRIDKVMALVAEDEAFIKLTKIRD